MAAVGACALLAGRGRVLVLGGLMLVLGAEAGLVASIVDLDRLDGLASPAGAAGGALGIGALVVAAAVFVRRPAWFPLAVLLAAPFRPPIELDASSGFPVTLADDGQLGRLLPLYFVLAAGALALIWRALHPERAPGATRALPRAVALPAGAFLAFACLSALWARELDPAVELLTYFTVPFGLLLALVARSPFPDWLPRALAFLAVGLTVVFAAVGLWQAVTQELFFFAPNLEVSNANSDYFRVTSLFGDPSLYGRHVVLGIGILLVALALRRMNVWLGAGLVVFLWGGLFFSYSQSSMVALVAITLGVAAVTGGRKVRRGVIGGLALVALLGAGFLASIEIRGDSLRHETSDRTQRVEDTARVIEKYPVVGVGLGGQPRESRRLSGRDRPTPNFVSHTTPLTVAAEMGAAGFVLYAWLIVGGALMLLAAYRLEPGLCLALGAAFLALFVHALFYSGFLEDPITWFVLAAGAAHLTWPRRDDGTGRQREEASPQDAGHARTAAAGAP